MLPAAVRLSRSVESAVPQIGDMPPQPPTLRGRIGAVLVQAVRRGLFWYTGQIRAFQSMVADAAREQTTAMQDFSARQQLQEMRMAEALDRLSRLEGARTESVEHLLSLENRLHELKNSVSSSNARITGQESRIANQETRIKDQEDRTTAQADRMMAQERRVAAQEERTAAEETRLRELEELQEKWPSEFSENIALLDEKLGRIEETLGELRRGIEGEGREVRRQIQQEKTRLLQQEFRLNLLLREVRKKSPAEALADIARNMSDEIEHANEAVFVDHAAVFRGQRSEIKSRLTVYTPFVREAFAATEASALDLGCGRGEWLELLRDLHIPASGIDWNRELVGACQERGLDAIQGEIRSFLANIPDQSLSIVSAFHVLEHIPFTDLLDIIDHAVRILKPGGIAIFETPNPKNGFVSTNNFYLDPTHRHPIPSELLSFVMEARGLCEPKVIPLSPYPDEFRLPASECPAVQFINDHFYGPQDYGIIARKSD